MAARVPGACEVCQAETTKHCGACISTFYCSREHQKQHWGIHKKMCPGKPSKTTGETESKPVGGKKIKLPPDSWAVGLSGKHRHEWFVDSYRLRLDDDYVFGCNLHGLYAEQLSSAQTIVTDFLVFCKLAVKHDVIPSYPEWCWGELVTVARDMLRYAFEKSDAREKYGGENVFTGMLAGLQGGRSLRYTSSLVYGFLHGGQDHQAKLILEETERTAKSEFNRSKATTCGGESYDGHFFDNVGGCGIWHSLVEQLK